MSFSGESRGKKREEEKKRGKEDERGKEDLRIEVWKRQEFSISIVYSIGPVRPTRSVRSSLGPARVAVGLGRTTGFLNAANDDGYTPFSFFFLLFFIIASPYTPGTGPQARSLGAGRGSLAASIPRR